MMLSKSQKLSDYLILQVPLILRTLRIRNEPSWTHPRLREKLQVLHLPVNPPDQGLAVVELEHEPGPGRHRRDVVKPSGWKKWSYLAIHKDCPGVEMSLGSFRIFTYFISTAVP